jgi:CubicO group peptidase (beta-lactamase class C family)
LGAVLSASVFSAGAGNLSEAIRTFLHERIEVPGVNAGIVIGIVDEAGSSVVSCGKMDNGTDQEVNGDTVYEIGSVGKTFTVVLLQEMIERGKIKLDAPVAKYLPPLVKMPARGGKQITLRHLATHYSGLPGIPDNLDPRRADNPYAEYTVEKLYAFLRGYQLTRAPGERSEYSNLGMGLLGHAIALQAGTNYEALVMERICRPLKMDSTGIALTPELKARFVVGHNQFGESVPSWDVPTLAGAGALRSTANDLVKYVSANLGLRASRLTPLMKETHEIPLAWGVENFQGRQIVGHGGGTAGCSAFVGFDKTRRRGVVGLTNRRGFIDLQALGYFLLKSEWRELRKIPDEALKIPEPRRPRVPIKLSAGLLDACVGHYEFAPDANLPTGMQVTIWREGGQLLAQARGKNVLPGAFELYPESETVFFDKISGTRSTFIKNERGEVTALKAYPEGQPESEGKKVEEPR